MINHKIGFIVCSNGFGHLKRVLLVVKEIQKLNNNIKIFIFCSDRNLNIAKSQINFILSKNVEYITNLSEKEINWLDPELISVNHYNQWIKILGKSEELKSCRWIISDNYIAPLGIYNNVIIMGSFLWHDVINFINHDIRIISQIESNLLINFKPNILCTGPMAMQVVRDQPNVILLPWFCENYQVNFEAKKKKNVLITGGGTGVLSKVLLIICRELNNLDKSIRIYVDSKLYSLLSLAETKEINLFSFTSNDFSMLRTVICRPGMGILTDCIQFKIPPIVINDDFNNEIRHNSKKVFELGLGCCININLKRIDEIIEIILDFINNQNEVDKCLSHIEKQPVFGARLAAKFILNRV